MEIVYFTCGAASEIYFLRQSQPYKQDEHQYHRHAKSYRQFEKLHALLHVADDAIRLPASGVVAWFALAEDLEGAIERS